jgi:hypothetical protein
MHQACQFGSAGYTSYNPFILSAGFIPFETPSRRNSHCREKQKASVTRMRRRTMRRRDELPTR